MAGPSPHRVPRVHSSTPLLPRQCSKCGFCQSVKTRSTARPTRMWPVPASPALRLELSLPCASSLSRDQQRNSPNIGQEFADACLRGDRGSPSASLWPELQYPRGDAMPYVGMANQILRLLVESQEQTSP